MAKRELSVNEAVMESLGLFRHFIEQPLSLLGCSLVRVVSLLSQSVAA